MSQLIDERDREVVRIVASINELAQARAACGARERPAGAPG